MLTLSPDKLSHGQVFPTLMGLRPLLNRLSGGKVVENALLLSFGFLLLLFHSLVVLIVPRLEMLDQVCCSAAILHLSFLLVASIEAQFAMNKAFVKVVPHRTKLEVSPN